MDQDHRLGPTGATHIASPHARPPLIAVFVVILMLILICLEILFGGNSARLGASHGS